MTIDYTTLDPTFSPILQQLVTNMENLGHTMNVYYGVRTLSAQAKLYRQSRSTAQVNAQIAALNAQGCTYLANILNTVGPQQTGPWATNAMPGESYHAWGLAADMFVDGDMSGGSVYDVLATQAIALGLTPGRNFSTPDSGHIQLGSTDLPNGYSLQQINDHFAALNAI